MKRILTAAVLVAATSLVFSQPARAADHHMSADEQAVRQTLKELITALGKNDTAALERIYADGYTFVGDNGAMMTKAERIAAFKSGELKYESVSHDVVSVRSFGDTAVTVVHIETKFAPGVKFSGGKFLTTGTFVKIKGRWQLVVAHNTRMTG